MSMVHTTHRFSAAIGFDGYIDRIARVVSGYESDSVMYFDNITKFSGALRAMAGLSGDLELVTEQIKIGGNAPLIGLGLAEAGVNVTLISATNHDIFKTLHENIKCISYGMPGDTLALEFADGKLMFADISSMRESVIAAVNNKQLHTEIEKAYTIADLCILTNWACMAEMQRLWEIAASSISKRKDEPYVLMDLADFTKRRNEDIHSLINFIRSLKNCKPYLGLNEKETLMLAQRIGYTQDKPVRAAQLIHNAANCEVIVHGIGYSLYSGLDGELTKENKIAKHPVISTGAGDRFNAAFGFALLQGYTIENALNHANQTAYKYVTTGG